MKCAWVRATNFEVYTFHGILYSYLTIQHIERLEGNNSLTVYIYFILCKRNSTKVHESVKINELKAYLQLNVL